MTGPWEFGDTEAALVAAIAEQDAAIGEAVQHAKAYAEGKLPLLSREDAGLLVIGMTSSRPGAAMDQGSAGPPVMPAGPRCPGHHNCDRECPDYCDGSCVTPSYPVVVHSPDEPLPERYEWTEADEAGHRLRQATYDLADYSARKLGTSKGWGN